MLSGDATGGMEAALQRQADNIVKDVEAAMSLLDEPAPSITAPRCRGPEGVWISRRCPTSGLCVEDIRDLLWDLWPTWRCLRHQPDDTRGGRHWLR